MNAYQLAVVIYGLSIPLAIIAFYFTLVPPQNAIEEAWRGYFNSVSKAEKDAAMASENFAAALKKVLVHEGGFSNHPSDPGGATMKGVTQAVYDAFRASRGLKQQSVRFLSENELSVIYRRQYWDEIRGDELPSGVDYCVFDFAVNSGPNRAKKFLQTALGFTGRDVDGIFGIRTMGRLKEADPTTLVKRVCRDRLGWLRLLNTWPIFGRGWGQRVLDVERDALKMI